MLYICVKNVVDLFALNINKTLHVNKLGTQCNEKYFHCYKEKINKITMKEYR